MTGTTQQDQAGEKVERDYPQRRWSIEELAASLAPVIANERVTDERALSVPTVAACVRVLSSGLSQLPMQVFRRTDDKGNSERARDHALHNILGFSCNGQLTSMQLVLRMMMDATLRGNAYAAKITSGKRLIGLNPLPARSVSVTMRDDWSLQYTYQDRRGRTVTLEQQDVLHIRGPYATDCVSQSPASLCPGAIAFCLAAQRYGKNFFERGARSMGGFRMTESGTLKDDAYNRLREQLAANMQDFRPFLLEDGLEYFSMEAKARDSQLLELRQFQINEICRMWGVQPHMVQSLEQSTNNNIETQGREFVQFSLAYWINEWESAIEVQLIGDEHDEIFAEFNVDALLRGDSASRAAFLQKSVGGPVMTQNEGRAKENLPPIEGADVLLVPVNMAPAGSQTTSSSTTAVPEKPAE